MANKRSLPTRYEIRVLEPKHLDWASAIFSHSNVFHSPVWTTIYPENKTPRAYAVFKNVAYLVNHQIQSGYSLGVFDKEYHYKRRGSATTEGALYWDLSDETANGDKLLEQMDFPLVSIALAYDSINQLDMNKMAGLIAALPLVGPFYQILEERDTRDPESWKAKQPGEVLFRNATSTRHDYEAKGIMGVMARHMMRETAKEGFRGIQIECAADAVTYVWSNPPDPFKGEVVSEFNMETYYEEGKDGDRMHLFYPSKQRGTKVYCTLK